MSNAGPCFLAFWRHRDNIQLLAREPFKADEPMSIKFFNRNMRLTLFVIFLAFPLLVVPVGHADAQADSSVIVEKLLVDHWDKNKANREVAGSLSVSYTHLTLPTNREV